MVSRPDLLSYLFLRFDASVLLQYFILINIHNIKLTTFRHRVPWH